MPDPSSVDAGAPLTVGFVGLGKIGAPMAANVAARSGRRLVGFDVAGTAERLPQGATAAATIADLADQTATVLLSLPDGSASLAVAAELAAHRGQVTTVIDLSTIGPDAARRAATLLAAAGITYCDGPVSGGVAGARSATISLMFSGPESTFADHRDLFASFAGHVFRVGAAPGQGQAMKLVNNVLSATALVASSEALAMGEALGLDLATMLEVVNVSSGRNTATTDKFPRAVLPGTFDAGFSTAHMTKDAGLFLDAARVAGTSTAVTAAVTSAWMSADETMPGSDFSEIWTYVRRYAPTGAALTAAGGAAHGDHDAAADDTADTAEDTTAGAAAGALDDVRSEKGLR